MYGYLSILVEVKQIEIDKPKINRFKKQTEVKNLHVKFTLFL